MKNYEPEFKDYLRANFPRHANEILKSNSRAWFSRLFYPFIFAFIPAFIASLIGLFFYYIKRPNFILFQEKDRIRDIIQSISLEKTLMAIYIVGGGITFICFLFGLMIGLSKAHEILFESEKNEISVKKLWLSEIKLQKF